MTAHCRCDRTAYADSLLRHFVPVCFQIICNLQLSTQLRGYASCMHNVHVLLYSILLSVGTILLYTIELFLTLR